MRRVEKAVRIGAPVEVVFDLFSDFENLPRWMEHIREVRRTGRRYTRWRADAPAGMEVEWEAETTVFEPDRRIAWRSVRGDIETDGEVVFTALGPDETEMRVVLGYDPPGGRLGAAFARLLGQDPERQLAEDLERFRRIAERRAGAGRGEEDARGRERDAVRREGSRPRERWREARDEFYRGPQRARSDEGYYEEVLGVRRRDEERARAEYHDDEERARREWRRRDEREEAQAGGRGRRFEQALREARRSAETWEERYRNEPRRGERERRVRDDERDEYFDERAARAAYAGAREAYPDEERRGDPREDERGAAREYRPRHAPTPREREREGRQEPRGTRPRDELLRRRGVDRLLEDPPSREWRRRD